jgi:2-hydroxymuconate-semialdehyde hydrolase
MKSDTKESKNMARPIPDVQGERAHIAGHRMTTGLGESTYITDLGRGRPVVFLHGSGVGVSASANWSKNLPAVAKHSRAVAFDLLGFGQTTSGVDTPYGIDAWVGHVCRVLDALALERVVLVGNSLGGWVALQTAIEHPARVAGVVTMGTGHLEHEWTDVLRAHGTPEYTLDGIRRIVLDFVVNPDVVTGELIEARYRAASLPGAPERYAAVIKARNASPTMDEEALARLDIPAMVIHGRQDRVVPLQLAMRLFNLIKKADLHIIDGCGHWAQIERAGLFNALVADFMARIPE